MSARYKTVVISSMIDSYVGGQKRSTFVSTTVDLGGVSVEEFRVEQLKVGLEVAVAAIQNALCRQELSEDEARTRVNEFKQNYGGFIERLQAKQQAQVEAFLENQPPPAPQPTSEDPPGAD